MATADNVLIVLSNPVAGKEDEYNRWYTDVHLAEVLETPGFVSAKRYKVRDVQMQVPGFPHSEEAYLTIYELDDNPDEAIRLVGAEIVAGRLSLTDSLDPAVRTASFSAITDVLCEEAGQEQTATA